eukprot:scaffold37823_cov201-Skeletonema_marinoi.AAC.4
MHWTIGAHLTNMSTKYPPHSDKFDTDWWRKRRRVSWRRSHTISPAMMMMMMMIDDDDGDVGCTRSQGQLMLLAILMMV